MYVEGLTNLCILVDMVYLKSGILFTSVEWMVA